MHGLKKVNLLVILKSGVVIKLLSDVYTNGLEYPTTAFDSANVLPGRLGRSSAYRIRMAFNFWGKAIHMSPQKWGRELGQNLVHCTPVSSLKPSLIGAIVGV